MKKHLSITMALLCLLLAATAFGHQPLREYEVTTGDNYQRAEITEGRARYFDRDIEAPFALVQDGTKVTIIKDGEELQSWPWPREEVEQENTERPKSLQQRWHEEQLSFQNDKTRNEVLTHAQDWLTEQGVNVKSATIEPDGKVLFHVKDGNINRIIECPETVDLTVTGVDEGKQLEAAEAMLKRYLEALRFRKVLVINSHYGNGMTEEDLEQVLRGEKKLCGDAAAEQMRNGR